MKWNWQNKGWPRFIYDLSVIDKQEQLFIVESSKLIGATSVINERDNQQFKLALMGEEALRSSTIEGEVLDRDSVTSSLLRQLGLAPQYSDHRANDKERGMAALMVDNYHGFDQPLSHAMMCRWHRSIVGNQSYLHDIGCYRTSKDPMQVVSGYVHKMKVHFEAPPAEMVEREMDRFVHWFNDSAPKAVGALPALLRAGVAHLYFLSIHPFEDGNGRMARVLSEKALVQSLGSPALLALSRSIGNNRKKYYRKLEKHQQGLVIDDWLRYFANAVIDSTSYSQRLVKFIVEKTRVFDRVRAHINQRQERALIRLFDAGLDGFEGGLSADKYCKMTGATSRTASRDLRGLVVLGALTKTGALKGTRYWLKSQF